MLSRTNQGEYPKEESSKEENKISEGMPEGLLRHKETYKEGFQKDYLERDRDTLES